MGPLKSDVIGYLAANPELYLCRRDAGIEERSTFDIFYHLTPVSNQQIKKMWDRTLHVSRLAGPIDRLNNLLPGGENHIILWPEPRDRDIHGLLPRFHEHISFTLEEERLGRSELRAIGIPEGALFICFHARDPEYVSVKYPGRGTDVYNYRDSNVHKHIPAAERMTGRGYFAIRMGAVVKEPLQTTNPMIIDYATKHRSDFMDIYLCANCYFFIGDESGFNRVPSIFRRPLANINVIPIDLIHTQGPKDLFILKKLWLREEGRFLKFREIFEMGANSIVITEQYEEAGIEPVENSAEEIVALAVEMDERLKGTWRPGDEDEELQRRFWALFKPTLKQMHGLIESRIGTDFLRQNQELLD